MMDMGFEQQVRERAYHLWVAHGMNDGMALDHWCAAEHDLKAKATPMKTKAAPKPAAVKAPAKGVKIKSAKPAAAKKTSKAAQAMN